MRQALECCHKGWGPNPSLIGVAGGGTKRKIFNEDNFKKLVMVEVWRGSAFGGVRRPQANCRYVED